MNDLPPELHTFREQFETATERDVRVQAMRRRRARRVTIAGVAAAALTASGLAVVAPWRSGPSLIERAEAALAAPPDAVVHTKGRVQLWGYDKPRDTPPAAGEPPTTTGPVNESWTLTNGNQMRWKFQFRPGRFSDDGKTFLPTGPAHTLEESSSQDTRGFIHFQAFDTATGVLVDNVSEVASAPEPPNLDAVTELRRQLDRGNYRTDGATEIDGKPVVRFVSDHEDKGQRTHDVYFVDATTFAPVRTEHESYDGDRFLNRVRTDYFLYEHLNATPDNVALTTVVGAHPGVPIRHRDSLRPEQIPGYVQNAG